MVHEIDRSDLEAIKIATPKLSWREKFAAIVVLLIGIVFLALQIQNLFLSKGNEYAMQDNTVSINRSELFHDIRFYLTAFLCVFASMLLFRKNKVGWMIGISFLILFDAVAIWLMIQAAVLELFDETFIAGIVGIMVLTLSIIFLLIPSARKKYEVGKNFFLPTLVFLAALIALFLFLQ
jgi:hypothetical protein